MRNGSGNGAGAGREYLMLCRGRPHWEGFQHKACRVDALARITYAGLAAGRQLHFVFEDCTMVQCTPPLLVHWKPWGKPGEEASEARFLQMLEDVIRKGVEFKGMEIKVGKRLGCCIEDIMSEGPVGGRARRFERVVLLRESGSPLLFESTIGASMLVVLGGVRDLAEHEDVAVADACTRLGIEQCSLALGHVAELTSKCIKMLEAAASVNFLQPALDHCAAIGWKAPPPVQEDDEPALPRLPLHLIYEIRNGISLADFVSRPEAAILVVDTFRGSHMNYDHFALTLLDGVGQSVTLHNRVFGSILRQADCLSALQSLLRRAKLSHVRGALNQEMERLTSRSPVQRLVVLYADESAPPIRRAAAPAFNPRVAVAVVFAARGSEMAARNLCSGSSRYLRASVGPLSSGPAFVAMLHNEGFLAPIVDPTCACATGAICVAGPASVAAAAAAFSQPGAAASAVQPSQSSRSRVNGSRPRVGGAVVADDDAGWEEVVSKKAAKMQLAPLPPEQPDQPEFWISAQMDAMESQSKLAESMVETVLGAEEDGEDDDEEEGWEDFVEQGTEQQCTKTWEECSHACRPRSLSHASFGCAIVEQGMEQQSTEAWEEAEEEEASYDSPVSVEEDACPELQQRPEFLPHPLLQHFVAARKAHAAVVLPKPQIKASDKMSTRFRQPPQACQTNLIPRDGEEEHQQLQAALAASALDEVGHMRHKLGPAPISSPPPPPFPPLLHVSLGARAHEVQPPPPPRRPHMPAIEKGYSC